MNLLEVRHQNAELVMCSVELVQHGVCQRAFAREIAFEKEAAELLEVRKGIPEFEERPNRRDLAPQRDTGLRRPACFRQIAETAIEVQRLVQLLLQGLVSPS